MPKSNQNGDADRQRNLRFNTPGARSAMLLIITALRRAANAQASRHN